MLKAKILAGLGRLDEAQEAVSVALYQEKLSQFQVDQAVFQGLLTDGVPLFLSFASQPARSRLISSLKVRQ